MTTMTNGRVRKNLADQLDRLDCMLEGLSEALNESVATAVREAVSAVLTELLTNPELQARLQGAVPSSASTPIPNGNAPKPILVKSLNWVWQRVNASIEDACQACRSRWQQATGACRRVWRCAVQSVARGCQSLWHIRRLALPVMAALIVGGLCGAGAYYAGPRLGAMVSGLGGFTTALGVQAGLWLRSWARLLVLEHVS